MLLFCSDDESDLACNTHTHTHSVPCRAYTEADGFVSVLLSLFPVTKHGDAGEAPGWVYRTEAELTAELLVPQTQRPVMEAAHPHRLHGFTTPAAADTPLLLLYYSTTHSFPRRTLEEWLQCVEVLSSR